MKAAILLSVIFLSGCSVNVIVIKQSDVGIANDSTERSVPSFARDVHKFNMGRLESGAAMNLLKERPL